MKINSIKIKGLLGQNYDVFLKLDDISNGCDEIFCSVADLSAITDFLFLNKHGNFRFDGSAECDFVHNGNSYQLARTKNFDNVASLLRCKENGVTKRFTRVEEKLTDLFKTDVEELFDNIVIESKEFDAFNANPTIDSYSNIADLRQVINTTQEAYNKAADRKSQLKSQLRAILAKPIKAVKASQLDAIRERTEELQKQYNDCLNEMSALKDEMRSLNSRENLQKDIRNTQGHIDRLIENSTFIDEKRKQLQDHNKVQRFLPQLKEILAYKKQMTDANQKLDADKEELEWFKSERQSIINQLGELNDEINRRVEQNTRLILIKNDSENIETLEKRNETLSERIVELQNDKEKLEQIKGVHKGTIETIDKGIEETKESLQEIDVPVRSINDLVENVRLSVKIKEVENQLQKTDSEMVFITQQLSDRELEVRKAQDLVSSLMKVDAVVTPLKSKDTLIKMLQSKISKSEMILQSLTEKQNTLRDEMQNLHYKEIEIDQSAECLQTILGQKMFDREVMLKKQVVNTANQAMQITDGKGGKIDMAAAPLSSTFIDENIDQLKVELVKRNNRKLALVSRQVGLRCVLQEVERQKQIVLGEIVTCRNERDEILRRFRELAKADKSEHVTKYFQALDQGKATNYMMDAQRGLVEQQTELSLLKEKYEDLNKQKQDIVSRLGSLSETQQAVDVRQMTVEMMVESNEQVKSALIELTEKLVLLHTQRKMESDAIEAAEVRIANVSSVLTEALNEKKANEKELLKIHQKVSMFVKGEPDEVQKAAQDKVNELVSEKKLLEEDRSELDDKILAKSVEIEKNGVVLKNLTDSYEATKQKAQTLMDDLGDDDVESIKLKNLSEEMYNSIKDAVDRFDATMSMLTSRMQHLKELYQDNADIDKYDELNQKLQELQQHFEEIEAELAESREETQNVTDAYISSNRMRTELTNIITQYNDSKNFDSVIKQTKIVELVFEEEIAKILSSASSVYGAMCGGGEIICDDDIFAVKSSKGKVTHYKDLSMSDKMCVFLSLRLCSLSTTFPNLNTVLLHGNMELNNAEMIARLKNLKGKNFIVEAMSTSL